MIVFHNRLAFWAGIVAVSAGVALHLPMYFDAADMDYVLAGMHVDTPMKIGMALIIAGFSLAIYGLVPRGSGQTADATRHFRTKSLDDAPLSRAHVGLLVVMAMAVTIDVMKPTTLGFVMPGMTKEYGLRSPLNPSGHTPVAYLPFFALAGMVSGSFAWGWLGDRIGRRASILLSGVMFIGTAICGSMPGFWWNVVMCFLMGMAVGGMLPIAFALLAETIPARHRSWLMVLIGGDVAGAYILTSFLASRLEPTYGWRILWLLGLPTGVLLILLNRWIPESPRFLLATNRPGDAEQVMQRFGVELVEIDEPEDAAAELVAPRYAQLFRRPFGGLTAGMVLFGLGWGLVNNGFLLWLPTNLRQSGLGVGSADRLLADASLIGFPATFLVAWAYGFWSSKGTMVIVASLTAIALGAFAVLGNDVANHRWLLEALIVLLLIGTSSVLAVLTPYSSEVYPTRIRARGTGLAGTASRAGGFAGVGVVVFGLTQPNIRNAAILGLIPISLAALAVGRWGIETRRRRLEDITAEEIGDVAAAV